MYTIEELVQKVKATKEEIIDWLNRNGKFIGENGYSDEILNELIDEFGKRPVYKPIQVSEPQKDDDEPDFGL